MLCGGDAKGGPEAISEIGRRAESQSIADLRHRHVAGRKDPCRLQHFHPCLVSAEPRAEQAFEAPGKIGCRHAAERSGIGQPQAFALFAVQLVQQRTEAGQGGSCILGRWPCSCSGLANGEYERFKLQSHCPLVRLCGEGLAKPVHKHFYPVELFGIKTRSHRGRRYGRRFRVERIGIELDERPCPFPFVKGEIMDGHGWHENKRSGRKRNRFIFTDERARARLDQHKFDRAVEMRKPAGHSRGGILGDMLHTRNCSGQERNGFGYGQQHDKIFIDYRRFADNIGPCIIIFDS